MCGGSCKASTFIFISLSMFDSPSGLYCLAMFSDAICTYLSEVVVGGMCVQGGSSVYVEG